MYRLAAYSASLPGAFGTSMRRVTWTGILRSFRSEPWRKAAYASAHVLTWAIGLLLLDNCDFAALRRGHARGARVAGALVVSLLAVEGANGVNLNPLVLT